VSKPIFMYAQKANGVTDEYRIESFDAKELACLKDWLSQNLKADAILSVTDNRYFDFGRIPSKVKTRIKCSKLNVDSQEVPHIDRLFELLNIFILSDKRFCFVVKG